MLVSMQALANYLEQDASVYSFLQQARAKQHIAMAGAEVRARLAPLYTIPTYTRDDQGQVTAPLQGDQVTPVLDPGSTALGPIVTQLAAAFLLAPARGFQPQTDTSTAQDYRAAARQQLERLAKGQAYIASLDQLANYGITANAALIAMFNVRKSSPKPGMQQLREGMFGTFHNPETGSTFDPAKLSAGEKVT